MHYVLTKYSYNGILFCPKIINASSLGIEINVTFEKEKRQKALSQQWISDSAELQTDRDHTHSSNVLTVLIRRAHKTQPYMEGTDF